MAIACSPATPTPITSTRAGLRVPAAVTSIGKRLGRVTAARRTPLYPPIVAIDDRTSMLCARVIRGMSSMAKAMTRRSASARTASGAASGSSIAITA